MDLLIRDTKANREKLAQLATAIGAARPIAVSELSATLTLIGAALPVDILFDRLAQLPILRETLRVKQALEE